MNSIQSKKYKKNTKRIKHLKPPVGNLHAQTQNRWNDSIDWKISHLKKYVTHCNTMMVPGLKFQVPTHGDQHSTALPGLIPTLDCGCGGCTSKTLTIRRIWRFDSYARASPGWSICDAVGRLSLLEIDGDNKDYQRLHGDLQRCQDYWWLSDLCAATCFSHSRLKMEVAWPSESKMCVTSPCLNCIFLVANVLEAVHRWNFFHCKGQTKGVWPESYRWTKPKA